MFAGRTDPSIFGDAKRAERCESGGKFAVERVGRYSLRQASSRSPMATIRPTAVYCYPRSALLPWVSGGRVAPGYRRRLEAVDAGELA